MAFEVEKGSLGMAFDSIKTRKMRSILTALGIIIGISTIIALVSIGEGTNAAVSSALGSLGANTIFITPSMGGGGGGFSAPTVSEAMTKKDLTNVQSTRGVNVAIGLFVQSLSVTFKDETKRLSFFGIDTKDAQKFFSDLGVVEVEYGRFFRNGEKNVVVLGHSIAEKTFENKIAVDNKLELTNGKVQAVGILKETGNSQYDSIIIAPVEDVRESSTAKDQYTIIFAKVSNPDRIDDIAATIQKKMDDIHGKKVMNVLTTKQLTERIGTVTNMLSVVLGGIAGIALIVAGVGIANTMLMSITERTKEIGIMKAIGASNGNIVMIFLTEAALLGLIGGIVGDVLGVGLSEILGIILRNYGLAFTTKVTPELLTIGLAFSVGVGVLFGFLPARKAARMSPMEALRYE